MAVRWRIRVLCSRGMGKDRGMAREMDRGGIDERLREGRYMCELDYTLLHVDAGRMFSFCCLAENRIGMEA